MDSTFIGNWSLEFATGSYEHLHVIYGWYYSQSYNVPSIDEDRPLEGLPMSLNISDHGNDTLDITGSIPLFIGPNAAPTFGFSSYGRISDNGLFIEDVYIDTIVDVLFTDLSGLIKARMVGWIMFEKPIRLAIDGYLVVKVESVSISAQKFIPDIPELIESASVQGNNLIATGLRIDSAPD